MNIHALQWEGYINREQIEKFIEQIKNEDKVKLSFSLENITSEAQLFSRTRAQSVDIIFPGLDIVVDPSFQFKEQGLVLALDKNKVPNFKDIISSLQEPKHLLYGSKLYGIPFLMGQVAFFYNSDKVDVNDLKDFKKFLENTPSDKLGSLDFSPHVPYVIARILGHKAEDITNFDKLSHDKNFLDVLSLWRKKASVTFTNGADSIEQTKNLNAFISWGYSIRELKLKYNQNWKVLEIPPSSVAWIDNIMVTQKLSKEPKKLAIIYKLINFLLSEDYQSNLMESISCLPINQKVIDKLEKIKGVEHLNELYKRENKVFLPPLKDRRTRNGFQYLWKNALKD